MIIDEMERPDTESGVLLRNRAFAARQDLAELKSRLEVLLRDQAAAGQKYKQAQQ